jgi:glycosyltransferase involved in cell wall biosynthesis
MKVFYYTDTCFLDIAIEFINVLKRHVELHVLIEFTSASKGAGLEKKELPEKEILLSPSKLLTDEVYGYLSPYFDGCASVKFVVNTRKPGLSSDLIRSWYLTWQYIKKVQPDIIHFEEVSLRQLGMLPFLFSRKKKIITIHDSVPHSGERNWKAFLPRFVFLRMPFRKSYLFYSKFAKDQFEHYFRRDKHPKYLMAMYPYSFYRHFAKESPQQKKHILFFGRLSQYKGLDILLNAISDVFKAFPNEFLVIAGRRVQGYNFEIDLPEEHKSRILIMDRFIPNNELVSLIQRSKFVVCPYLDATQSGVLMTSFALNVPVIASCAGAFPEYIINSVNGILVPVGDPVRLSEAIILTLKNDFYKIMMENISNINKTNTWIDNKDIILNAYQN